MAVGCARRWCSVRHVFGRNSNDGVTIHWRTIFLLGDTWTTRSLNVEGAMAFGGLLCIAKTMDKGDWELDTEEVGKYA